MSETVDAGLESRGDLSFLWSPHGLLLAMAVDLAPHVVRYYSATEIGKLLLDRDCFPFWWLFRTREGGFDLGDAKLTVNSRICVSMKQGKKTHHHSNSDYFFTVLVWIQGGEWCLVDRTYLRFWDQSSNLVFGLFEMSISMVYGAWYGILWMGHSEPRWDKLD
ncbi:hypothetical protein B0T20DRAFT_398990 [Sordaria brevicollis]|uniref:Uncharacterized protein n=1 Tax=Sordaria brevicollis TaxID=83679 RepID=A0AAE0UFY4_SORBR|nr:hypothetical protein B0T20DRAFT_398990 [Sordaria brevicollis]